MQNPVVLGRHSQERHIEIFALCIDCFKAVGSFGERRRCGAAQFDIDAAVVFAGGIGEAIEFSLAVVYNAEMGRYARCVEDFSAVRVDAENGQIGRNELNFLVGLGV